MKIHYLALCICVLLAGCTAGPAGPSSDHESSDAPAQESSVIEEAGAEIVEALEISKDFGSYMVPAGWVEFSEASSADRPLYVKQGVTTDSPTSNFSVEVNENKFAVEDHEQLWPDILIQLTQQVAVIEQQTGTVAAIEVKDSFSTPAGDVVYVFVIDADGLITTQYYIGGDYRHCLIHITDFSDERVPDLYEAAQSLVDSFQWAQQSITANLSWKV